MNPEDALQNDTSAAANDARLLSGVLRGRKRDHTFLNGLPKQMRRFIALLQFVRASRNEQLQVGLEPDESVELSVIYAIHRKIQVRRADEQCRIYREIGTVAAELFKGTEVGSEYLVMVQIDISGRLISQKTIATGDSNHAKVDKRKALSFVENDKTSYVVLAHAHPNGVLMPSSPDISVTLALAKLFDVNGTPLIEHYVIAGGRSIGILHADGEVTPYDQKSGRRAAPRKHKR